MADTLTDQARNRANSIRVQTQSGNFAYAQRADAALLDRLAAEYVRLTDERDTAIGLLAAAHGEHREAEGRCVQLTEQLAEANRAEGLPDDAPISKLIEHHRANAALAAQFDVVAAEAENTRLRAKLEEARRIAVDGDDGRISDAMERLDAIESVVRAALAGEDTPA